jgi:hypothetical protein
VLLNERTIRGHVGTVSDWNTIRALGLEETQIRSRRYCTKPSSKCKGLFEKSRNFLLVDPTKFCVERGCAGGFSGAEKGIEYFYNLSVVTEGEQSGFVL